MEKREKLNFEIFLRAERKLEEAKRKRQKSCKLKTLRVSEWGVVV
jgi:hypothetical protein